MDSIKSFKGYGKVDELEQEAYQKKTRKRLIILIVSSVILLAVIVAAVTGTVIHKRNTSSSSSSNSVPQTELAPAASLKAVCDVTQYPNSCFAAISSLPNSNTTDPKLLFKLSLRVAIDELSKLSSFTPKLRDNAKSDQRLQKAIDVCGTVFEDALNQLNDSISSIGDSGAGKVLPSSEISDVETWLSAVMTNQETCIDAVRELNSTAARGVLQELETITRNSTEFVSNSLAIVTRILGLLSKFNAPIHHRKLLGFGGSDSEYPAWVGGTERRLLQANVTAPDAVVAKDGSGQFRTIGEALKLVKKKSLTRFVLYVKEGTYIENIDLDKNTWNVMITGDGKDKTIVSGSRNFKDGTPTFETATFAATYLGRPWKDFSTTIIMQTDIGSFLKPVGWISWVPNVDPVSTIFYAEYQNSGPGAGVSERIAWAGYKPSLTDAEAGKFTVPTFIQGPEWLPNTAVEFDSTL
ncbi:unnamed protein product [Lupinus luteus]|uniref:pectinesterase n=1 Tax=Lupinus luteus TaxID=3873 RepID=A0AAV1WEZ7_LUPLU